jgi:hypothetical protein
MTTEQRQEKAKALKAAHKTDSVFRIFTTDENGKEVSAWVRKPSFENMNAFSAIGQSQPIKAMQVLLNTIWLEGDEIIRTDIECFMSVMPQLHELVKVRHSDLEKF